MNPSRHLRVSKDAAQILDRIRFLTPIVGIGEWVSEAILALAPKYGLRLGEEGPPSFIGTDPRLVDQAAGYLAVAQRDLRAAIAAETTATAAYSEIADEATDDDYAREVRDRAGVWAARAGAPVVEFVKKPFYGPQDFVWVRDATDKGWRIVTRDEDPLWTSYYDVGDDGALTERRRCPDGSYTPYATIRVVRHDRGAPPSDAPLAPDVPLRDAITLAAEDTPPQPEEARAALDARHDILLRAANASRGATDRAQADVKAAARRHADALVNAGRATRCGPPDDPMIAMPARGIDGRPGYYVRRLDAVQLTYADDLPTDDAPADAPDTTDPG